MSNYFITGTDTGCGKTTVTAALARDLVARGRSVACFKPVASGCEATSEGLRNDDALKLQAAAGIRLDYDQINPVALEPAIAPHIAAERAGVIIDIPRLARSIQAIPAEIRLIEGAGGWLVPLGPESMTADLARAVESRVILVVGVRLGCINHALLSARAIRADGLPLHGWIANILDPSMPALDENLETLERLLGPSLARYESMQGLSAQPAF
ncbi:MAG: dethiobiotin synthase [Wenzhouxiangella sp.]|jgi:dethiobiotin synthetase|nr:dethiobiotin synthase [Wenzhouxiangella sp.]